MSHRFSSLSLLRQLHDMLSGIVVQRSFIGYIVAVSYSSMGYPTTSSTFSIRDSPPLAAAKQYSNDEKGNQKY